MTTANISNEIRRMYEYHLQTIYVTIKIENRNKRCQSALTDAVTFPYNQ